MKVMWMIKSAVAIAVVLLLAGCILQPTEDTGTVSLAISAEGGSIGARALDIESSEDTGTPQVARVWMYSNGSEFRLTPTTDSAPSSPNYAETVLTGGRGEIVIDGVPAGEGYSLVVVLGERQASETDSNQQVFVPTSYARTGNFRVSPGLATVVTPNRVNLVSDDTGVTRAVYDLVGRAMNSVVLANGTAYAADGGAYYERGSDGFTQSETVADINSLSVGEWLGGGEVLAINTDTGIEMPDVEFEMPSEITNVTLSGTFLVDNDGANDDAVVFYQRIGGLGGGVFEGTAEGVVAPAQDDWEDISATELNDEAGLELLDPDTSPVRSLASSGNNGFFATDALGNFMVTEELFTDTSEEDTEDLQPADFLSGDVDGLTPFNVPYPGTTRPLRLDHMEVVTVDGAEFLVVGTPRGAFTFPINSIGGVEDVFVDESNTVRTDGTGFRSLIRDEAVSALTTDRSGELLAIATAQSIVVLDVADGIPTSRDEAILILPQRGASLGQPNGIALELVEATSTIRLYVAGVEGMTTIEADR